MPIPSSGAISMSMFNTELGRASNTSNSSLAGGTTPAVGSLFWLANQSGSLNQTAPHAMSEWYGYSTGVIVYITLCDYASADGSGGVTVSATATANVNTTITIYWSWEGVNGSLIGGSTTITTGNSFGTNTVYGASSNESILNLNAFSAYVSPGSFGTQTYDVGGTPPYSCY
jgi:hypothetical protein